MQAPPLERSLAQSESASARVLAPICTMYIVRRPRLKLCSGFTKGSRPARTELKRLFACANSERALAFEKAVVMWTAQGCRGTLGVAALGFVAPAKGSGL